jgi:hypothetical protein
MQYSPNLACVKHSIEFSLSRLRINIYLRQQHLDHPSLLQIGHLQGRVAQ